MLDEVTVIPASQVTRLGATQTVVGESPRWLPRQNCLVYMDIVGQELRRFDPITGHEDRWSLDQVTGCVIETTDPQEVLLAQQNRLALFNLDTGELKHWRDFATDDPETRGNDGRVDPLGRFWISTMNMMREPRPPVGKLYSVTGEGEITPHMQGFRIPNALAFSPMGDRMYFADSPNRKVWQYDRDLGTGAISNRRPFFAFDDGELGIPDGACVDTEGGYWVGVAEHGARVERRLPDGRLDVVIELPADCPTMCAFGGLGRDQLFITTFSRHLSDAERAAQPDQGALFMVETGFKGLPETPFHISKA